MWAAGRGLAAEAASRAPPAPPPGPWRDCAPTISRFGSPATLGTPQKGPQRRTSSLAATTHNISSERRSSAASSEASTASAATLGSSGCSSGSPTACCFLSDAPLRQTTAFGAPAPAAVRWARGGACSAGAFVDFFGTMLLEGEDAEGVHALGAAEVEKLLASATVHTRGSFRPEDRSFHESAGTARGGAPRCPPRPASPLAASMQSSGSSPAALWAPSAGGTPPAGGRRGSAASAPAGPAAVSMQWAEPRGGAGTPQPGALVVRVLVLREHAHCRSAPGASPPHSPPLASPLASPLELCPFGRQPHRAEQDRAVPPAAQQRQHKGAGRAAAFAGRGGGKGGRGWREPRRASAATAAR
eukprot:TRINITY_DN60707_c0_g1_i1.p2 TRINITY_DN60707_c0_g1~~TRINITY_DN60707_c0_g1_i1.p2  ORF type:complete len:394 (+),score=77.77 TRINITY_DN60707_c0_g1_i1:111-1184(+)